MRSAIYPGTFDPITFGHIDIIKRATEIFDNLIIASAKDNNKNNLFDIDERVALIESELKRINLNNKVEVKKFDGLLVDFAKAQGVNVLIRGLRAISDFEYEFQMFGMNAKLNPEIQTIFLPASESHQFIASKLVKEVARLGGDISKFVPTKVEEALMLKLKKNG